MVCWEWGGQQPQPVSLDFFSAAIEDYLLPTYLEVPSFAPPAQLAPTIYPSEEGVTERGTLGRKGQGPPMLSAAVRIHLDPHKNVKVQVLWLLAHMRDLGHFLLHTGAGLPPSCLTAFPSPGIFGDSTAAQSHSTPLHGPT